MTAPKGSGGPPTEPGWYLARWSRCTVAPWPTDYWGCVRVEVHGDDPEFAVWAEGCAAWCILECIEEWGPRIPTPDDSEPAPPTDGPTEFLSDVGRDLQPMPISAFSWGELYAEYEATRRVLAESRAEVERLRTDLQTLMSMRDALASDREALRDRVRVLESAIRKCRPTLDRASHCLQEDGGFKTYSPMIESIKDAQRAIDRALATTQEPPASTDGPTLGEKTEASWYLALEESRAEVERLRAERDGFATDATRRLDKVGAAMSECAVLRERVRVLTDERDEARRGWCEAIAGEYGTPGPVGGREYAAQKWGRDVALGLYPDDAIKAALMEHMPEDEAIEEAARYRHDFDKATTQEPPASKDDHGKR